MEQILLINNLPAYGGMSRSAGGLMLCVEYNNPTSSSSARKQPNSFRYRPSWPSVGKFCSSIFIIIFKFIREFPPLAHCRLYALVMLSWLYGKGGKKSHYIFILLVGEIKLAASYLVKQCGKNWALWQLFIKVTGERS